MHEYLRCNILVWALSTIDCIYIYILSRATWIVDFSVLWKKAQGSFVYCREVMAAAGGEIGKVVNVNVGGILYTTTLATLTKVRLVEFYRIYNVECVSILTKVGPTP